MSSNLYRNKHILIKHGLLPSVHVDNAEYERVMHGLDPVASANWTLEHCSLEDQLDSVSYLYY